jgi:hypothetical protein
MKHKKIIGNVYFGLGVILTVTVIVSWQNDPGSSSPYLQMLVFIFPFLLAGYSLIAKKAWSRWVCLPVSILFVFTFPVGTVIGGYYLWFFWQHERVRS